MGESFYLKYMKFWKMGRNVDSFVEGEGGALIYNMVGDKVPALISSAMAQHSI